MARWWFNRDAGPKSPTAIARQIVAAGERRAIRTGQPRAAAKLFDCICERCKKPFQSLKRGRRFHSTGCGVQLVIEKHALASAPRLRFMPPKIDAVNRRFEQRREHDEGCTCDELCEGPCILDRRKFNRRGRNGGERKPDKYIFNGVQIDSVTHTAHVKKPELIFAGSALGKKVTPLFEPSKKAAKELKNKDVSPFEKFKRK